MKSIIQQLCAASLLLSLAFIAGCGVKQVNQSSQPADQESTEKHSPKDTLTESSQAAADSKPEVAFNENAEVSDDGVFDASRSEDAFSVEPDKTEAVDAKEQTTFQPSVPEPSEEQLAHWKLRQIDELKLVASVKYDAMGFTQRIRTIPSSRRYLLGGSTITLWTIGSTKPDFVYADWRKQEDVNFVDMAVAPSGAWFVAANSSGDLIQFELAQPKELAKTKIGHSILPSISVSPDSRDVAIADFAHEITILSADDLSAKKKFKIDSRGIRYLRFIAADRLLVAAETISVWDTVTGTKVQELEADRYYGSLSLSPSGELFTYGSSKGLKICRTSDYGAVSLLPGNWGLDELVEWKNEDTLATISGNLIRIWDVDRACSIQSIDNRGNELAGACWIDDKILAIASLLRRTRHWASVEEAVSFNLSPIQEEIEPAEEPAKSPSTVFQLVDTIDLRSFPRLPDAVPQLESETMAQYTTRADVEEAKLFCRYALSQAGWTETEAASPVSGYMSFLKQGFQLDCSVTEIPGQGTTISMTSLGNFDMSMVPALPELSECTYKSARMGIYVSKADLLSLEVSLLRAMTSQGWIPYSRLASSHSEEPDQRSFSFLKNSCEMRVSISKHNSQAQAHNIQFTPFAVSNSIPIPTGCTYIEYNGTPELQIVAATRQNQQELTTFFNDAMKADGWTVLEPETSSNSEMRWLLFCRDQQDVTIGLQSRDSGWTLVTVGNVSSSGSFQLAEPDEDTQSDNAAEGIQAADFPLPETVENVEYKKLEKELRFEIPNITLEQFIKQYSEKLAAIGWVKDDRSMVEKEFCYADFSKDSASITLRGNLRGELATCSVQGDGLLWSKPLPKPKIVTSYETWLRNNRRQASLEFLDEYQSEMQALKSSN